MTCPSPLPAAGTLTGWTGVIGGTTYAPADCSAHEQPYLPDQWEYPVIISDKAADAGLGRPGLCQRDCQNQRVKGERWVLLGFGAGNLAQQPAPYPPASSSSPFRIDYNATPYAGDTGYWVNCIRVVHTTTCRESQRVASAGYVELTKMDATGVAGYLDLTFAD